MLHMVRTVICLEINSVKMETTVNFKMVVVIINQPNNYYNVNIIEFFLFIIFKNIVTYIDLIAVTKLYRHGQPVN